MKGHMQDGKFHPHTQYKGVRRSRDQSNKLQGTLIRKKLAEIPSTVTKGNAFNDTDVKRPRVQTIVKNPYEFGDNQGITLSTDPNNPINIDGIEYWFDLVVHWGKKQFGLEVQTCAPHKPEGERDKFTGKDCFGGFIAFSDEPEPLLEILDKSFNVKFDNRPEEFDLWKRKIKTEFKEPEPQASAMQKRIERTSEEIEVKSKVAIKDLLANAKLRDKTKTTAKETMEWLTDNLDLEINNFDFNSATREEAVKELYKIRKSIKDSVKYEVERDFAQDNPARLKEDPKLSEEFPIVRRLVNEFRRGMMDFAQKRILGDKHE